jgi:predicted DNA-binding WGR domain protein
MPSQRVQLLVLDRADPVRDVARYYVLSIEPTLFGGAAIVRESGRFGTAGPRGLDLYAESYDARIALNVWLARRLRGLMDRVSRSRLAVFVEARGLEDIHQPDGQEH